MSDTAKPKTKFRQGIVYATHDGVELRGDLYLPAPQLGRWIRSYERHLNARPKAVAASRRMGGSSVLSMSSKRGAAAASRYRPTA